MRQIRRLFLGALLLVAGGIGGELARVALPRALAAARVTAADPRVSINPSGPEADLATFVKGQGITTQAGWTAWVQATTGTQLDALARARLIREVVITP